MTESYCTDMNGIVQFSGSSSEPFDIRSSVKQGYAERGSSAGECRTRNEVSPGSNPPLLPFRRLGIFVLSIDALVDSPV